MAADVSSAIMQSFQHLGYLPTEDQFNIVKEFLAGRDVFVSLPTAHGKSLCYACFPLSFDFLNKEPPCSRDTGHLIQLIMDNIFSLTENDICNYGLPLEHATAIHHIIQTFINK